MYKIIVYIERATTLWANIMRVMCEYEAGEGVLSYLRLMSDSSVGLTHT